MTEWQFTILAFMIAGLTGLVWKIFDWVKEIHKEVMKSKTHK